MSKNKQPIALLTGVNGQDGSFLAELLLKKGYYVVGIKRRSSIINTSRIDHLYHDPNFKLEYGDMNDVGSMYALLEKYKPDEIYNLAAQSHVRVSFEVSEYTVDSVAMGTLRLLNAMKLIVPKCKFYQASSSEIFGSNPILPLNEESKFQPCSPYACAKTFSHQLIHNYRESYGLFACSGILMNHESEKRGETFVSRKVTLAAARIKLGLQEKLQLGNLESKRDWGYAGDFVEAMYLMLQQNKPDDFVICTGEAHSIKELVEYVFDYAKLGNYEKYVEINPRLFRPQEVPHLLGNFSKAKKVLGWEPKVKFEELMRIMYDHDLKLVQQEIAAGKIKWQK